MCTRVYVMQERVFSKLPSCISCGSKGLCIRLAANAGGVVEAGGGLFVLLAQA